MSDRKFNSLRQTQDTDKKYLFANQKLWTTAESEKLYNLRGWGEPYFFINTSGNLAINLKFTPKKSLDLYKLVKSLVGRGIEPPILFHFPDILTDRIARLYSCMKEAIARYQYPGSYQGVFPIKCNQNPLLVEAVVKCDRSYQFGLEVGSKPELIIAIAKLKPRESDYRPLLICNGYKDREYIAMALLATKLDHQPIIVIERLQELDLALEIAAELEIAPIFGIRAKLNTQGTGRWGNSTGDRAKFGLSVSQILQLVEKLTALGKLDCLQLLHFHIGSQISAISAIKAAIREGSQIYVQLAKIGANMRYLDVGGGLGVDYDGSQTNTPNSKNYSLQNYANDIVAQVKDACDRGCVAAPTLVSESGTAIAAPQSVLVTNVLSSSSIPTPIQRSRQEDEPLVIRNFWETYLSIDEDNYQETFHDAIQFKQEALSLFNFGYLSLEQRAIAEELYWTCCRKIAEISNHKDYLPEDLQDLERIMASVYYINLSVFQSLPDAWATERLFPIMPLHRLNERPTVKATLADLTCDSDGKIDRFIGLSSVREVLPLHSGNGTPYYLGIFLVGAYQEVMGNLHNLFGRVNLVQVQMNAEGEQIEKKIRGDKIETMLADINYDPQDLTNNLHLRCQEAIEKNLITLEEAASLLQNYKNILTDYTYSTKI